MYACVHACVLVLKKNYQRGCFFQCKVDDYSRNHEDFSFHSWNVEHNPKFPRNSRQSVILDKFWFYFLWIFRQITNNICIYIQCTDGTLTPARSTYFSELIGYTLKLVTSGYYHALCILYCSDFLFLTEAILLFLLYVMHVC